jgi:predicted nuclease with TOPRIM domain
MNLNKAIMTQKQSFATISEYVKDSFLKIEIAKEELKSTSKGMLMDDKIQLEDTVKNLMGEVENLSKTNQRLLDDLNTRAFFQKYCDVLDALNTLQSENEALVNSKYAETESFNNRNVPHTVRSTFDTVRDKYPLTERRHLQTLSFQERS